jgi:hypothetical protein
MNAVVFFWLIQKTPPHFPLSKGYLNAPDIRRSNDPNLMVSQACIYWLLLALIGYPFSFAAKSN